MRTFCVLSPKLGKLDLARFHDNPTASKFVIERIDCDYVFLELFPIPGTMTYNAYSCGWEVVIVTEVFPTALAGLGRKTDSVPGLRKAYHRKLSMTGILITCFDFSGQIQSRLKQAPWNDYGSLNFRSRIRYSTVFS